MDKSDNIDHFNRVVLLTFDKLYAAFPVPSELMVAEIAKLASPETIPSDAPFKLLEPTYEAIRFLGTEGFLSYSDKYQDGSAFLQVQLTMKGLTVLGGAPDSLERQASLISKIRELLAAGAKSASAEVGKKLVAEAFKAAMVMAPALTAMLQKS